MNNKNFAGLLEFCTDYPDFYEYSTYSISPSLVTVVIGGDEQPRGCKIILEPSLVILKTIPGKLIYEPTATLFQSVYKPDGEPKNIVFKTKDRDYYVGTYLVVRAKGVVMTTCFSGDVKGLDGRDFRGSWLDYSDFSKGSLRGADFTNASLFWTKFIDADLQGANLTGANLAFSRLLRANLRGADLRGAVLKGASFIGVKYDSDTKWPKGFVIESVARVVKVKEDR